MNIFEIYLEKIKSIIGELQKNNKIIVPDNFNGINAEIPPQKFNCDISTNVAMVLSKINNKPPLELADQLAPIIKDKDKLIETITIAKPGFINIKFKKSFWANFTKDINDNSEIFGINQKEKKNNYLVEFVSANPTGPLHVGHCRGAILGDVISNIFIIMLKEGKTSLSEIVTTCESAASLYTESLKLLQYCLQNISLKQITDIKRLVYMKTVGTYLVKNEYNVNTKSDSDLIFVLRNSKAIVQSFIICTVMTTQYTHGNTKKVENKSDDMMLNVKHLELYLNCIAELEYTPSFIYEINAQLHDEISQIILSEYCTTRQLSLLLIKYCIKCQIWKYIYEKTKNLEITKICFESLNSFCSEIENENFNENTINKTTDIQTIPSYVRAISELK